MRMILLTILCVAVSTALTMYNYTSLWYHAIGGFGVGILYILATRGEYDDE